MINMTSQLVAQPGTGTGAALTASRMSPEAVVAGDKSNDDTAPAVHGGMDTQSVEALTEVINQLNGYLEEMHRSIRFSIDEDSGRTVTSVVDTESDEVIRQIPTEEMLALSRKFSEITGKIFDAVA